MRCSIGSFRSLCLEPVRPRAGYPLPKLDLLRFSRAVTIYRDHFWPAITLRMCVTVRYHLRPAKYGTDSAHARSNDVQMTPVLRPIT